MVPLHLTERIRSGCPEGAKLEIQLPCLNTVFFVLFCFVFSVICHRASKTAILIQREFRK